MLHGKEDFFFFFLSLKDLGLQTIRINYSYQLLQNKKKLLTSQKSNMTLRHLKF